MKYETTWKITGSLLNSHFHLFKVEQWAVTDFFQFFDFSIFKTMAVLLTIMTQTMMMETRHIFLTSWMAQTQNIKILFPFWTSVDKVIVLFTWRMISKPYITKKYKHSGVKLYTSRDIWLHIWYLPDCRHYIPEDRTLRGLCFLLASCWAYSLIPKMKAALFLETPVYFYYTTWCYFPQDSIHRLCLPTASSWYLFWLTLWSWR
jgi:hypothetical protein